MRSCSLLLLALTCGLAIASPVQKQVSQPGSSGGSSVAQSSSSYRPSSLSDVTSESISAKPSLRVQRGKEAKSKTSYGSNSYVKTIDQGRREVVESLEATFQDIKDNVLSKGPLELSRKEQLDIAEFRLKVQMKIDNYRRYQSPFMKELQERLLNVRDRLTKKSDYIDWEKYDEVQKKRAREAAARFKAREKVRKLGIDVKPRKKELQDDPPHLVKLKRINKTKFRQRIKQRRLEEQAMEAQKASLKGIERERLFREGWGYRKPRGSW